MPLLSVVIPVFKVEKYLRECVDSVLSQDVADIEVVLVDDGSPDGCPIICDEYAKKDKRVVVVHKQNGGVSSARNVGIRVSTGEYICFLDSDDKWNPGVQLSAVLNTLIKTESDFVCYNSVIFMDGTNEMYQRKDNLSEVSCKEFKDLYFKMVVNGNIHESVFTKIFKRSFLYGNGLFFQEGLFPGEDTEWIFRVYRFEPKVSFSPIDLYMYRMGRVGSITNTKSPKTVEDLIRVINQSIEFYRNKEDKRNTIQLAELGHCATLWFIALSVLPEIRDKATREKQKRLLKKSSVVLDYRISKKAQYSYICYKILGFKITSILLCFYSNKHRIKANLKRCG